MSAARSNLTLPQIPAQDLSVGAYSRWVPQAEAVVGAEPDEHGEPMLASGRWTRSIEDGDVFVLST